LLCKQAQIVYERRTKYEFSTKCKLLNYNFNSPAHLRIRENYRQFDISEGNFGKLFLKKKKKKFNSENQSFENENSLVNKFFCHSLKTEFTKIYNLYKSLFFKKFQIGPKFEFQPR
jgi:hypothetical protein